MKSGRPPGYGIRGTVTQCARKGEKYWVTPATAKQRGVRFHLSSTLVNTDVDGDRVAEIMTIRKTLDCCGSKVKTVIRESPRDLIRSTGFVHE
ncbi:hypothetical protein AG1IA_07311 [Rhizoctonia solani AG-1 IA]|uniref:Uncharacterized protein n=1 Tax=Thanatephorus cucumeris (strain AG1-IA) TaxID=983506 RepID=L8WL53_THACA|nr:hypothetical protein AG1IA_07311 [Rhizoctonia solani AG-1 IA]